MTSRILSTPMQGSKMELVIDGALSRRLRSCLREVLLFRSTILAFAERDIRVKYK